jgi:hypothetical protein
VAALGAVVAAVFVSHVDARLGDRTLSPRAAAAVRAVEQRTLARADVRGLSPAEARAVADAADGAAVRAFHIGMGIAGGLVALGGLLGLAGIVNPRREVRSEDCAGGQIAGIAGPPERAAA